MCSARPHCVANHRYLNHRLDYSLHSECDTEGGRCASDHQLDTVAEDGHGAVVARSPSRRSSAARARECPRSRRGLEYAPSSVQPLNRLGATSCRRTLTALGALVRDPLAEPLEVVDTARPLPMDDVVVHEEVPGAGCAAGVLG